MTTGRRCQSGWTARAFPRVHPACALDTFEIGRVEGAPRRSAPVASRLVDGETSESLIGEPAHLVDVVMAGSAHAGLPTPLRQEVRTERVDGSGRCPHSLIGAPVDG